IVVALIPSKSSDISTIISASSPLLQQAGRDRRTILATSGRCQGYLAYTWPPTRIAASARSARRVDLVSCQLLLKELQQHQNRSRHHHVEDQLRPGDGQTGPPPNSTIQSAKVPRNGRNSSTPKVLKEKFATATRRAALCILMLAS